jgi:hypothetical protein
VEKCRDTRGVNEYHGRQISPEGIVYELGAVVGLDGFDGEAELCGDIVAKIGDVGCNLRFANGEKSNKNV